MKLNLKTWTIIDLSILGLIGGWHYGYSTVIVQIIIAVGACVIFGAAMNISKGKKWFSQSALITGLIISFVLAPGTAVWRVVLVSLIAMASKFIKFGPKHLFNPAAVGLVAGLFFGAQMGWWAAYSAIATILVGAHLLYELKGRWKMVFAFFATLIILFFAQSLLQDISFTDQVYLTVATSFFFVFFMLTDPMTTPFRPRDLIKFGIIAAVGTFLLVLYWPPAIFIGGLLVANAFIPVFNKRNSLKQALTQASGVV